MCLEIVSLSEIMSASNLVTKLFQLKKFFMQVLEFDRSVCMSAVSYSVPLSAVLTKQQLHREKRT